MAKSPEKRNAYIIDQKGVFAAPVNGKDPLRRFFALMRLPEGSISAQDRFRAFAIKEELLQIFGVDSVHHIPSVIENEEERRIAQQRAYELYGKAYGIKGDPKATIEDYGRRADAAIREITHGPFAPFARDLELTNEIPLAHELTDIIFLPLDGRFPAEARFEGVRKVDFMRHIASIESADYTNLPGSFKAFNDFLNEHFWSPKRLYGQSDRVYFKSFHDSETFACQNVEILPYEVGRMLREEFDVETGQFVKLRHVRRRQFLYGEQESVDVYFTFTDKSDAARILKMIRKDDMNPHAAIDDDARFLIVVQSYEQMEKFLVSLRKAANKTGSALIIEEPINTLDGREYNGTNGGSSRELRVVKCFVRMGLSNGQIVRVEFMGFSPKEFVDYENRDELSHDEYEVRRLVDTGVASLLFPQEFTGINFDEKRHGLIQSVRQDKRRPSI